MDQITKLFVSLGLLTTLTFDSEITTYLYGGSKEDIFINITNNMRTLAIKPKREGINSNLLVITKNRKYYFDISYDEIKPHKFIEVKTGQINHGMKKIKSFESLDLLEGETSTLVINKSKNPIRINGLEVKKKKYLSFLRHKSNR